MSKSERLDRLWLWDFVTTLFARAPRIVVPEIEHGLAEMLDDVAAIEIDVFDQRAAFLTIKNHVFVLSRRTATLDHHANRVRWPHWSMRNVRRDKECFAFPHKMINDSIAFADAHFDVAFQLVEILFRIDEMKIVPRIRALDDHHEKVAPVIKILIAHRRFKLFPVLLDPFVQINRRLHS